MTERTNGTTTHPWCHVFVRNFQAFGQWKSTQNLHQGLAFPSCAGGKCGTPFWQQVPWLTRCFLCKTFSQKTARALQRARDFYLGSKFAIHLSGGRNVGFKWSSKNHSVEVSNAMLKRSCLLLGQKSSLLMLAGAEGVPLKIRRSLVMGSLKGFCF